MLFGNLKGWAKKKLRPAVRVRQAKGELSIVLAEIKSCGACKWISSFLNNRKDCIRIAKPQGVMYPLAIRRGTSDSEVYRQIFVEDEYGPIPGLADLHLVVDCGANVGFSSVYFLSRSPECHVIAVEPDPENFAALINNLEPYGTRFKAVCGAIWSNENGLLLSRDSYGDRREWARQVRVVPNGTHPEVKSFTIPGLLESYSGQRVSLLKIDIEGAEAEVFKTATQWLHMVDTIAIELHDDTHFGPASAIFFEAIKNEGFHCFESGELTICVRR